MMAGASPMLKNGLTLVGTIVGMELVAALVHRYVMHGMGWGWHRSHHEPHDGTFELNDLYAIVFAGLAFAIVMVFPIAGPFYWIGIGMSVYGLLYFFVHDGLVHQRWPFRHVPRNPYLKRLVQAHRLHHVVEGREGCVSFGFLWAPPVRRLRAALRDRHGTDLGSGGRGGAVQ